MPAAVIDLKNAEDPRDVVHRTVQALAEGKLVVFPTETLYGIAASALNLGAVKRLSQLTQGDIPLDPLTLVVKSADDALDFVPHMSALGRRLCRRCWPGPLTFQMDASHPESVLRRMPAETRGLIAPNGLVGLRVPFHDVILSVSRLTIGPLVMSGIVAKGDRGVLCGDEVVEVLADSVELILNAGRNKYGQPATIVDVTDDCWRISRPGVVSEQALERLSSMMILLVCTGNTCRSPMAELLLKKQISEQLGCTIEDVEQHGVVVSSAGIAAMAGGRPSAEAVKVMEDRGLDLSEHFSQPLTERLARHADLILTMTQGHRNAILAQWPELAPRTFVVSRNQGDISDPIGGPLSVYEKCATQINEQLGPWVQDLDLKKSAEK